jgi:hypothetical protein
MFSDELVASRTNDIATNKEHVAKAQASIPKRIPKLDAAVEALLPVIEELGVQAGDVNLDPFESRFALPSL